MSGGSYDYAYGKVEDFADSMRTNTPLRRAFKKLVRNVALAMHDIEWEDSGDTGEGDSEQAIRVALGSTCEAQALVELLAESHRVVEDLKAQMQMAQAELDANKVTIKRL